MIRAKDPLTQDMFMVPQPEHPTPGSANYAFEVSHLVSEMLKGAEIDRWEIAAQMSRLSGDDVSKNMIDAWASPARADHNIPFYRVALLEEVVSANDLTIWLAGKRGGQVGFGQDVLNAQLGKAMSMKKKLDQKIRELQKMMERLG